MNIFRAAQNRWLRFAKSVENSRPRRLAFHGVFFCVNAATLYGAIRYLQETKHRALPGSVPPSVKFQVPAQPTERTEELFNSIAADYDSRIGLEERVSYIWYMRRQVAKQLTGHCLEVACGTLRNLPYFPKTDAITSCTFLDPSLQMLELGKKKFEEAKESVPQKFNFPSQFVEGRAEDLPELCASSNQKFDTVFETFGLCSHEDPVKAIQSMAAVLAPNGRIVLLEHGRGDWALINNQLDKKAAKRVEEWGCRWNLDLDDIVAKSGLEIETEKKYHFGTSKLYILKEKPVLKAQVEGHN